MLSGVVYLFASLATLVLSTAEGSLRLRRRCTRRSLAEDAAWMQSEAVAVDPLSLVSLLSQGFDESQARRALRLHNNDTQ